MDGNSAKTAPVLDHLVATGSVSSSNKSTPILQTQNLQAKPVLATTNGSGAPKTPVPKAVVQNTTTQTDNAPQNRRTDKSEFEIQLTNTVNKIMLEHFEHASEQIVQKVLSEVRARLPGQRKS